MTQLAELKPARQALATGILNPTSLTEALQMAEVIAKSSIVPKDYQGNPGNVLVAIQWGMEIGLPPLQAMQNIAVINGRPSLWGDALIAVCKASPLCEYVTERYEGEGDTMKAVCITKRRGDPEPVIVEFSVDDAKKAQLLGKPGPWQQYPKRMLKMRARAFALRDAFPDVLKGMASAEEEQDRPREVAGLAETTGPAPVSRVAALKERLAASLAEPPTEVAPVDTATGEIPRPETLDGLLASIAAAPNRTALRTLKQKVMDTPEPWDREAKAAYREKLAGFGEEVKAQ